MTDQTRKEQPKCKACGDTKRIPKPLPKKPHPCNYVNLKRAERTISCPKCTTQEQLPAKGMTKRFNEAISELLAIFTVSQAMARNSFDSVGQPVDGKTDNPDPLPAKEYMHQWLKKDAVCYDMPNEEIIKQLANENEELEAKLKALLAACEEHKRITVKAYGYTHWSANYKRMEAAIAKQS